MEIKVFNNNVEKALKIAKKKLAGEGLFRELKRRRFYENYFGADWADPLEYHLTVNSGRLGPAAVDVIAAAGRYCLRSP